MGRVNGLWVDDLDLACEAFLTGELTEHAFTLRLKALGLDAAQIEAHVDALSDAINKAKAES